MGLFDLFSAELTDRKATGVRKKFWALAQKEAARRFRNEVWYADVLGLCLADEEARAALDACGRSSSDLQKRVATFQSPEERSDQAARSGAFVVTENQFSWPLDRALDRAIAARRRQKSTTVRALDVMIGAISPDEQDLAKHLIEDCYAVHFDLAWEVAHPGLPKSSEPPPKGEAVFVLYSDPFSPRDFVQRQLGVVPNLDDTALGAALDAYEAGERTVVSSGEASLLAGLVGHVRRERELAGHPLRVEVESS